MTTRVLSVGRKVVGILFVVLVAAGTGLRPQPADATNPIVGCRPAESSGMPLCSGHPGTTGGAEVGQSTRLMVWWADAAPGDAAGYAYDIRFQKDVSHSPVDQTVPQCRYVMRAKQRDDLAVRSKGAAVPEYDARLLLLVSHYGEATNTGLKGFSAGEQAIIRQAEGVLNSSQMASIRAAHAAGRSVEVTVNGVTIVYEPGMAASGMTLFGERGFVIGREAFSSAGELNKTVLHELYRLNTSASASGVSGALATAETNAAAGFADRAAGVVKVK